MFIPINSKHRFKKQVEAKGGVKAYRFGPDHRAFADPDHEPENRCYCPSLSSSSGNSTSGTSSSTTPMPTVSTKMNSPQCAPHGTFNVSLCQYGKSLNPYTCMETFAN